MVVRSSRELLYGALVVALLALAFLWRPIEQFDAGYFSPADLSQAHALTRVESGVRAGNVVVSDTWTQMQPWAMFDASELSRGRLPLWNRFNGGGVPHLANFQSAVFSPFTWPHYVFGLRLALIAAAFLKLWALGFCTFLFLRELRLSFWAATFGGVVYMFAGHQVLTLGYPHSGVSAALPAVLFAIERLARRFEETIAGIATHVASASSGIVGSSAATSGPSGTPRSTSSIVFTSDWRSIALLISALTLGLLAGHPETFYFVASSAAVYAIVRGASLWLRHRGVAGASQRLATLTAHVGVAVALAAGICAIQLLPFFEYLRESAALVTRTSGAQTPLPTATWPMQMFPNLLGNPANNYFVDDSLPRPGFETVNMAYVGGFALLMAIAAPFVARRRKAAIAFVVAAAVWVAYAYDVLGFARFVSLVPTLDVAPMNRSQIVFDVCVAAAAAFTVDALVESRRRRQVVKAVALFSCGVAVVWMFRAQAFVVANRVKTLFPPGDMRDLISSGSLAHVEQITLGCLVGLGTVATLLVVRRGRARAWLGAGLVAVAFAQSGGLFSGYHPVTRDAFFYPRTAALDRLVERVGTRDFVVMGKDGLPPATNMVYGLRQIANYDALSIRRYDQLYRRVFNEGGNWREIERGSSRALQLFGIEYVLSLKPWVDVDTSFARANATKGADFASAPMTPDAPFTQEFVGVRDGLDGVSFTWEPLRTASATGTIDVRLVDVATGQDVCARRLDASAIGRRPRDSAGTARADDGVVAKTDDVSTTDDGGCTTCLLRFASIPNSKGRAYRLTIRALDVRANESPSLTCRKDMAYWIDAAHWVADGLGEAPGGRAHPSTSGWRAQQGDATVDGHLRLELHHARERFVAEDRLAGLTLFRFQDACSRYHTVSNVIVARDDHESWDAVLSEAFDPRATVVLEAADPRLATAPIATTSTANGRTPHAANGDPTEPNSAPHAAPDDEPVEILSEDHGLVRLRTHRARAGWLVTSQSWYPGWIARVNAEPARLECANYAFTAVPIPAGESTIELEYAPKSVARGRWLSLASLLVASAWLTLSWRFASRGAPRAPRGK